MAHPAQPTLLAQGSDVAAGSLVVRHPVTAILVAGTLVTALFMALAVLDVAGLGWLWDNAHWTFAPLTGVAAGLVATRQTSGFERRVRAGMTGVLAVWLAGRFVSDVLATSGPVPIPSLADAFFLATLVPIGGLLALTARRFLEGAERTAVHLDALVVFFAAVACIVLVHPGPTTGAAGWSTGEIVGIIYAAGFLATVGAALIGAVATRAEVAPRGIYLILGGSLLAGVAYAWWLTDVAAGGPQGGTLPGYLVSIGLLVVGAGIATWRIRRETRPMFVQGAAIAREVLPLAAVVIAAGSLLVPGVPDAPQGIILKVCAVAATILLVARQTVLLRERETVLDELRGAHTEAEAALEANRALAVELQDRMEQMQAVQRQLIHASRQTAVGELASAIAHEVNNPLTGVLGYADLLLADLPESGPGREELETIRSEALRARHIIRTLVEFARPHDPEHTPTDLDDLVRQTIDLVRYHIERGGVRIVETYGDPPTLPVDRAAVGQVLINSINNAVQAMPSGGELKVQTGRDGHCALVRIEDDGSGMDDATLARIFEPFFTTRAFDAGHGLGLPASQGIIEAHGGTIEVSSEPGRGTRVEIRLPLDGPPPIAPVPPTPGMAGTLR